MTGHTKEPWKTGSSPDGKSVVFLVGDEPEHTLGPDENWIDCNTAANARRIVACVNACRGIRTEALEHRVHALAAEDDTISVLKSQRDQLLAALEAVLPWVVTQEIACNGLKCREPVCMSCFDDSEQSAENAADAYQLAEQAIAAVKVE